MGLLGLSYKTAPVDVRERLAVSPDRLSAALAHLRSLGADEAVLLSTCNRVEAYWAGEDNPRIAQAILESWTERAGVPLMDLTYASFGAPAVRHLFRVAAGLDSMVLGEPQILGQVKASYQSAMGLKATGGVLNRIFQRSMQAGKRARTETRITQGVASVAEAAVVLSERIFGDLTDCGILILGAGKMAEAAAKHLVSCKPKGLFVANRTWERAQELSAALGAKPLPWAQALSRAADADVVICSTGAPHYVITPAIAEAWRRARSGRPMFIIDIAVPRNVDPAVNALENMYVYDIDELKKVVSQQAELKRLEAAKAEAIIDAMVQDVLAHADPGARVQGLAPRYA